MRWIKITFLWLLLAGLPVNLLQAAEAGGPAAQGARRSFNIGPFPVTNSMLVTWIVAIGVIVFAQYATRNMKDVPDGAQNFWEFMVESLYNFLEEIVGAGPDRKSRFGFLPPFSSSFFSPIGSGCSGRGHHRLGTSHAGGF